jgi:coenzyme F420-0:L-glutamate ligase / coenzyme F420-1:gamma-L-glutamate ligase
MPGADYTAPSQLELVALRSLPMVKTGDELAPLIVTACQRQAWTLQHGDVLVVAQKIVSKSEGRLVRLADVTASARAIELAARTAKDPRLVELILSESKAVLRVGKEVIIVEHRLGFVLANAGVDQSNVNDSGADSTALLLPEDPDASAQGLQRGLLALTGRRVAVIINDSWGRAWRRGVVGHALGVAGLPALLDLRGRRDLHGRALRSTEVALADELAAAGSLLMGQANEGRPVVIARGLAPDLTSGQSRDLLRPPAEDLFR